MPSSEQVTSAPDILGPPYTAETLDLPDDDEGQVVATLVHRPAGEATDRAVLHVHGFADYFFQTAYAEWWTERGRSCRRCERHRTCRVRRERER